jgi:hypothetical protein
MKLFNFNKLNNRLIDARGQFKEILCKEIFFLKREE